MPAELWTLGVTLPKVAQRQAQRAEAAGWDGILYVDSQNLAGDTYVALAGAATATERLGIGTGVTNPLTRHPAVTAAAAAHIQAESGGRMLLGIGRGDSSLAHLGLSPVPVGRFERYLAAVQAYLRGDEVPFDELPGDAAPPVEELGLRDAPTASRLEWLRPEQPKVPVAIAATGPKVVSAAARHAEQVLLSVGALPERIRWGIDAARRAREEAGLDPDGVSFGAFVNVVAHPDPAVARDLVSGGLASFARFSVMHGSPTGPLSDDDRRVLERVHSAYDMTSHTQAGSSQTEALDPDFVDRFGVVGPSEACIERIEELAALGLDRLVVIGPTAGASRGHAAEAQAHFTEEVMPALRR